jgi:hypothetical protein
MIDDFDSNTNNETVNSDDSSIVSDISEVVVETAVRLVKQTRLQSSCYLFTYPAVFGDHAPLIELLQRELCERFKSRVMDYSILSDNTITSAIVVLDIRGYLTFKSSRRFICNSYSPIIEVLKVKQAVQKWYHFRKESFKNIGSIYSFSNWDKIYAKEEIQNIKNCKDYSEFIEVSGIERSEETDRIIYNESRPKEEKINKKRTISEK